LNLSFAPELISENVLELFPGFAMARQRIRQTKAGARSHARGGVVLNAVKIFKETVRLLRIDLQLLHSELAEKVGVLGVGLAFTTAAVIFLIVGIVLLFVAAIAALVDYGFSLTVAALVVAAALGVLGMACLWFGLRQLQAKRLMPLNAIRQAERDLESIGREFSLLTRWGE
jgi:uncharacterized membrane protein YqjE